VLQCLPSNNNLSSLIRDAAVRSRGVASVRLTTPRVAAVSNVAWSLCLSVCLCVLYVTLVSLAKAVEPIEMPFVVEADSGGPEEP